MFAKSKRSARRNRHMSFRARVTPRCEQLEPRYLLAAFDLGVYEPNPDALPGQASTLIAPPDNANDFSGVAYTPAGTMLIIDDDAGKEEDEILQKGLYEYSVNGSLLDEWTLNGFDSPEAIYHIQGNQFAIVEEEDIFLDVNGNPSAEPVKHITLVNVTSAVSQITKPALPSPNVIIMDSPINLFQGDGPEGLAFDPNGGTEGLYYIAKEKGDPRLYEVDPSTIPATVTELNVPGVTGLGMNDLSDIYFAQGDLFDSLFVVSDQGRDIRRINLATNSLTGPSINVNLRKFEGLSFTPDSFQMFVVSDHGDGTSARTYRQYRNFTVYNPAQPDLTASSDTGTLSDDDITNDTTPTFTGTVAAHATVWLCVDGVQKGDPVESDGNGDYTITAPTLSPGLKAIRIRVGESTSTTEANRSPTSDPLNIFIDTTSPRIQAVAINGPNPLDGNSGSYDVDDGSGDQLQTVPIGGANGITIAFSEGVDVEKSDLTLYGAFTATFYNVTGSTFTPGSSTATWDDFAAFPADKMELTLSGSVTDIAGNELDGFWDNPEAVFDETSDTFPSGNGTPDTAFEFYFTILPGDANRDNVVGFADIIIMDANFDESGSGKTFEDGDFNGDGKVDNDGDYHPFIYDPDVGANGEAKNFGNIWLSWDDDDLLGDIDRSGAVNGLDVDPFVDLILYGEDPSDPYDQELGDMNDDGAVNGLDVDYFVDVLLGGYEAILEPYPELTGELDLPGSD